MSDDRRQSFCHPDGQKSCGACCGMYNHVEHDESKTAERLRTRTRAFYRQARVDDPDSLEKFRHHWEDKAEDKLLKGLPSCPFLGFIDLDADDEEEAGGGRVGCLVHPLQNEGLDGRDCGIYDRFICEDYLCAAHDVLRAEEVQLVIDAVEDSYLYGLAITNPKFVRHLLELVARRTGARPTAKVLEQPAVISAAQKCFEHLRDWPFRSEDGIFGQVRVAGMMDTQRRKMPAEDLGVEAEPVDVLLVCLGTECDTVDELDNARRRIRKSLIDLAEAVADEQP